MGALRRIIGVLVMIAGVIGLVLSLAGLVGLFAARPRLAASARAAITTFSSAVEFQPVSNGITGQALGGASPVWMPFPVRWRPRQESVQETQPVIIQVNP